MARRRELKGIANAINESFVSRNNDCKGYWSIGQIKSLTLNNGLTSMTFPLMLSKANPTSGLQNYTACHYANMLKSLLKKQKLPNFWVNNAVIEIDFNPNVELAQLYEYTTSGELFQCSCQITSDAGRDYTSIIYGRCWPHAIAQEFKSTRNSS
ncbi:hypothetical protein ACRXLK_001027 [Cronobacter turicensis]|nr:hypothetical protein [Cronobacter turicensis]